jgi:hypothetical protein
MGGGDGFMKKMEGSSKKSKHKQGKKIPSLSPTNYCYARPAESLYSIHEIL